MERELVIMPGAPLLVPELAGGDEAAARLRGAVTGVLRGVLERAGAAGAGRPLIVRRPDERFATGRTASLAAWGADVRVGAGNHLPELLARWALRAAGAAERDYAGAEAVAVAPDPWEHDGPLVVVADGPAALTARAPLTLIDGASDVDGACADIAAGRVTPGDDPLAAFGPAALDRVGLGCAGVWQDLARFAGEIAGESGTAFEVVHRDASHGVGYHVARWSWW
ncbi:hypothetical protein [Corynebacterium sp. 335C]